ncbi:MAG: oxygenase MpaB family protein [Sphingomicrobium sp.]
MSPANFVRKALIGRVRARFNDLDRGERPVERSDNALFAPDSVAWRVHGDVTTMMVGGISALLVEMLHPLALGGVWDHSNVASDMVGRLRRTARFIALTTFGERQAAEAAIARVRSIHGQVQGSLPDGSAYRADDPALLAWIHVAGSLQFLDGWRRYGEPGLSAADQDRYFAEVAQIARMLGADSVPETRAAAEALVMRFRPELRNDERTGAFRRLVLDAPAPSLSEAPLQRLLMAAAVDLMPEWARTMHGLRAPIVARPAVRGATFGLAGTLRWAFAGRVERADEKRHPRG